MGRSNIFYVGPPQTIQEFQGPIFMIDSLPIRLDGFMLGPTSDQMAL